MRKPTIERYLREQIRSIVLAMKILVGEFIAVDGLAAGSLWQ